MALIRLLSIALLSCFCLVKFAVAVEPITRFEHIGAEQGLSQTTIFSIAQDSQGFIWFATFDGLNRYDGYNIKVFRHQADDPYSISDNLIQALYVDHQGKLWVGTQKGLNQFDPHSERFQRFLHQSDDPFSLSHNSVRAITEDPQGRLWIGTYGGGLNRYDAASGKFHHYVAGENGAGLVDNRIWTLAVEENGALWIGTSGGLDRMQLNDKLEATFTHYIHDKKRPDSLSDNKVYRLLINRQGELWAGTLNGLNRFNPEQQNFRRYINSPSEPNSLSDNTIRALFEDLQGTLWVGSEKGGVNRFNRKLQNFTRYRHHPAVNDSLSDDEVWSIFQDSQGLLWFGTDGGVNKLDLSRLVFNHYSQSPSQLQSLSDKSVWSLLKDQRGRTWVGTQKGLNLYDSRDRQIKHYLHDPQDQTSLSYNVVKSIFEDSYGRIWIGTQRGVNRYDPATDSFRQISSLEQEHIRVINEDAQGNLWFGSWGRGLIKYNPNTEQVTRYRRDKQNSNSLSHDYIYTLAFDRQDNLWIGTYGGGLNRLDMSNENFSHYMADDPNSNLSTVRILSILIDSEQMIWVGTVKGLYHLDSQTGQSVHYDKRDGLANDIVYAISQDLSGQLWLSTNKGLSRFDLSNKVFHNFDVNDGIQSNEFNNGAYYASADGELFFGGVNGFNRFYPKQIKLNTQLPKVVLTEFLLANQAVSINPNPKAANGFYLSQAINQLDELVLTHEQPFISFEFTGLHFSNPGKNQYAYKLEGLTQEWIYTDAKKRWATFTNLPAGEYTLRIKASNHHGVWNEQGKTLRVKVLPPPWLSWWAYLSYGLFVIGSIIVYVHRQAEKVRNERAVVQRLTAVDQLKDDFLANTSHELRTPLNGIIGLAESLLDGARGEQSQGTKKDLAMVVSSGKRLANLINDILDFSKLKNRHLELNLIPVDLRSMVDVVFTLDRVLLDHKKIKLTNAISKDLPAVLADENRLAQILHNLIGNAIKFTQAGEVKVSAEQVDGHLLLKVDDSGIGIAEDKLESIFNSFEQIEAHVQRGQSGTGLGLSVTKQLVELHGGSIKVESTLGEGSSFIVELATTDRPAVNREDQLQVSRLHVLEQEPESESPELKENLADQDQWRVLVVDDEPVNRQVLNNHLSRHNYQLVEASSGQQALDALEQQGPFDLVLLDIMMPKLSGYEVCAKLRQQHTACSLPVIFLTAKNQVADMVHSFEVGGNDYLSKPISKQELLTRVETHLKFLDIHRNLEDKVAERTVELEQKNQAIIETQQQLIQSEKMAALGTLTAGVAHEINNPIHFAKVSSQTLNDDLQRFQQLLLDLMGDDGEAEVLARLKQEFGGLFSHLHTIKDGIERINIIVKDLRAFTQLDNAEFKTVNFAELIQATVNLIRSKHQQTAEFELQLQDHTELSCYPAQLNQVLMNLISNACWAIKVRQQQAPYKGVVTISCQLQGPNIEVKVKDNGCGISEQTQNKVFEPFFTTKQVGEGSGLGLSIAYGIVQQHHGELSVKSTLGRGSVFTLRLPVS